MSSLVLLSEQSASAELAALVERLGGADAAAVTQLAAAGQRPQLLAKAVVENKQLLLSASDDDATAAFSLAFRVASELSGAEAAQALLQLAQLLTTGDATQRAQLKLSLLTTLVNLAAGMSAAQPNLRFTLLLQLLQFAQAASAGVTGAAAASSPAALVLHPLSTLAALVDLWKLSPAEALQLYGAAYQLARTVGASGSADASAGLALGSPAALSDAYLLALLRAVDAAAAEQPALLTNKDNHDLAVQAVARSVACGMSAAEAPLDASALASLRVVQTLAQSNSIDAAAATELLRIVVDADVAALPAAEKKYAAFLSSHGIDASLLLRKVRTLALCRLAVLSQQQATTGDQLLSYDSIRSALQLPAAGSDSDDGAVESAVIDAVMAGRLDAKMDQDQHTLQVKRVVGGVPLSLYSGASSQAAWSSLAARLKACKHNLHTVLTTLTLSQHIADQENADDMQ